MAQSGKWPTMRLRFRGHTDTLNALCQVFHDRPRETLTAAELADITGRPFRDVYQRLSDTGELFAQLPAKKTTTTRYRLMGRVERMTPEERAAFIRSEVRAETRTAAAIGSSVIILVALCAALSIIY